MFPETVVLKIRDGDPLSVSVKRLTSNSRVFTYLILELRYDEIEMEDFTPDLVTLFLAILEDGSLSLSDIQDVQFRELNKISMVFEVWWLVETCGNWLNDKIDKMSDEKDVDLKVWIFDECLYILRKWESKKFMNYFTSRMITFENTDFISRYMEEPSSLDETQLSFMMIFAGKNVKIFLELMIQNIDDHICLSKTTKFLMEKINLPLCFQINPDLFHELFHKISILERIESNDLIWAFKLSAAASMEIVERRKMKKSETVFSRGVLSKLYDNSASLEIIVTYVIDGRIASMFAVVELIVEVLFRVIPTQEEVDNFIFQLCEVSLCSKEFKRVSKQFLTLCIAALQSVANSTKQDNANSAIGILQKIENRTELSSIQENVQLSHGKIEGAIVSLVHTSGKCSVGQNIGFHFQFNHPLIANCKKVVIADLHLNTNTMMLIRTQNLCFVEKLRTTKDWAYIFTMKSTFMTFTFITF